MVNRPFRVLFALFVFLSATTFAPPAQALPNEIYTKYYDCNLVFIGWRLIECDATTTSGGVQGGAFKRVERIRCDGSGSTVQWYDCTTGTCTLMSSPPSVPPYYC